jgi:hypothetical protein
MERKRVVKERKETASGGTRKEEPKRQIPQIVPRRPRTDNDDFYDFDIFYQWETLTPTRLQRAEIVEMDEEEENGEADIVEVVEEENVENEEEGFYGFEDEVVEEALELQALFREDVSERVNMETSMEGVENEEMEIEDI